MDFPQIKQAIDGVGAAFDAHRQAADERIAADMARTVLEVCSLLPPDTVDEALIVRGAVDRARQVLAAFDPQNVR